MHPWSVQEGGCEKLCLAQAMTAQALVYRWAGSVESFCRLSSPGTSLPLLGNLRLGFPALDRPEPAPRQSCALRGELLPLVVLPQLVTTAMASTNCVVFSWHHQGRVECLFLELSASHNIHFLRVTRGGRAAWGSVGTWHAFAMRNGPRLCLRSFSCCLGACLRDLTFDVDPCDPRRMIDGTGRVLYYKGILRMQNTVPNPHRRLQAITEEDGEWIVL